MRSRSAPVVPIVFFVLATPLAVFAADGARFPTHVTSSPIAITAAPPPTRAPEARFPSTVTAAQIAITAAPPTPSPTPPPSARLPSAVVAPPIQINATGGR